MSQQPYTPPGYAAPGYPPPGYAPQAPAAPGYPPAGYAPQAPMAPQYGAPQAPAMPAAPSPGGAKADQFLSLTTSVGRLVQGDTHTPSEKDMQGNPLVVKSGPNAGQPRKEYFVAVAFPKNVAEVDGPDGFKTKMDAFTRSKWPHLFTPDGRCTIPGGISDKWIDGDGYDSKGQAWNTREGFAGHWVLRASSGYAPKVYPAGSYADQDQLRQAIPRGHYVRILISSQSNDNHQKPGMYVNLNMVEHSGHGQAITTGPSAASAFGGGPGQLPPGASATPLGGGGQLGPSLVLNPALTAQGLTLESMRAQGWTDDAMVQAGHAQRQQPAAPPPMAPPPMAPLYTGAGVAAPHPGAPPQAGPPVQPYGGFMQPPGAPQAPAPAYAAPPPMAPPPAAPMRQMTATANGVPYEAWVQQGWTDAALIQAGYMLPAMG